jgi:hypothetical protein
MSLRGRHATLAGSDAADLRELRPKLQALQHANVKTELRDAIPLLDQARIEKVAVIWKDQGRRKLLRKDALFRVSHLGAQGLRLKVQSGNSREKNNSKKLHIITYGLKSAS